MNSAEKTMTCLFFGSIILCIIALIKRYWPVSVLCVFVLNTVEMLQTELFNEWSSRKAAGWKFKELEAKSVSQRSLVDLRKQVTVVVETIRIVKVRK